MITSELVREYFEYRDGEVYWRVRRGKACPGDRFGSADGMGYRHGMVHGKMYREHTLVFLLHHGYLPGRLDHVDGNRSNNLIENLREVSHGQNMMNARMRKDNKTGCKGVFWITAKKKWRVEIVANKKKHYCGYFEDYELACLVAEEARDLYHGKYARNK